MHSTTLIYNSKTDLKVTRDDLVDLITPPPSGPRHSPYAFHAFVDNTVTAIEAAGFIVQAEDYAITKDENRLFGLINVSRPQPVEAGGGLPVLFKPDWNMLVALRGSHDQSISRALALGSEVMVCSNLCFHGDLGDWRSKQTLNLRDRMPNLISEAITGLSRAGEILTIDFDRFNATEISRESGDALLLEIFRAGGFSPSQLGRAIVDWDECSVPEHAANGRTMWWLFNSATAALKPTGANANHNDVHDRSTIVYNKLTAGARQAEWAVMRDAGGTAQLLP